MDRHRLIRLANRLDNDVSVKNALETPSNASHVDDTKGKPTRSKSKTPATGRAPSKQSKKQVPIKSPKKSALRSLGDNKPTLEDRVKVLEEKVVIILNDLVKHKTVTNDIQTKMLHFQNDLETTKRAYSELIYLELSKSNAEIDLMPPVIKQEEQRLMTSPLINSNTKTNETYRPLSNLQSGQAYHKSTVGPMLFHRGESKDGRTSSRKTK